MFNGSDTVDLISPPEPTTTRRRRPTPVDLTTPPTRPARNTQSADGRTHHVLTPPSTIRQPEATPRTLVLTPHRCTDAHQYTTAELTRSDNSRQEAIIRHHNYHRQNEPWAHEAQPPYDANDGISITTPTPNPVNERDTTSSTTWSNDTQPAETQPDTRAHTQATPITMRQQADDIRTSPVVTISTGRRTRADTQRAQLEVNHRYGKPYSLDTADRLIRMPHLIIRRGVVHTTAGRQAVIICFVHTEADECVCLVDTHLLNQLQGTITINGGPPTAHSTVCDEYEQPGVVELKTQLYSDTHTLEAPSTWHAHPYTLTFCHLLISLNYHTPPAAPPEHILDPRGNIVPNPHYLSATEHYRLKQATDTAMAYHPQPPIYYTRDLPYFDKIRLTDVHPQYHLVPAELLVRPSRYVAATSDLDMAFVGNALVPQRLDNDSVKRGTLVGTFHGVERSADSIRTARDSRYAIQLNDTRVLDCYLSATAEPCRCKLSMANSAAGLFDTDRGRMLTTDDNNCAGHVEKEGGKWIVSLYAISDIPYPVEALWDYGDNYVHS